ncbi:50S ribosomal protein L2 [Patescibacteria group bacterium]|nr:MAG: 50S ribosomal protein L2 [Patescibacteria group bacterium]
MPLKQWKPTNPGRRHGSVDAFTDLTKTEPEKRLIRFRPQQAGRNSQGKITVRHRGGGARRFVRLVDNLREKYDVPAKVAAIEYDPSRGARLALLYYRDGEKRYIIAPQNVAVGESLLSSKKQAEVKPGNRMPLQFIPVGLAVHAIELEPGAGAKLVRGAGVSAQLLAVEGAYAQLRLPSGETRLISKQCSATIGLVSNPDHRLIRLSLAGRRRHQGIKPTVRGKAMNPVDHPHGGGEGKHPIGLIHPKTPWGKPALGVKTRDNKKWSNKFIVARRRRK